jgi:hypothetical protein
VETQSAEKKTEQAIDQPQKQIHRKNTSVP